MCVSTCRSCDMFLQLLQRCSRCLPGKPYNSWGQSDWMRLIWAWITDDSWAFSSFCMCWPGRGDRPRSLRGTELHWTKKDQAAGDKPTEMIGPGSVFAEQTELMERNVQWCTQTNRRGCEVCDPVIQPAPMLFHMLPAEDPGPLNPANVLPFPGLYMISDEPPITKLAHHFSVTADSRPVFLPRLAINYLVRVHFLPPLVQLQCHAANIQICCHNTFVSCKLI